MPADSEATCRRPPAAASPGGAAPRPSPRIRWPRVLRSRRGRRRSPPVASGAPSKRCLLGMPSRALLLVVLVVSYSRRVTRKRLSLVGAVPPFGGFGQGVPRRSQGRGVGAGGNNYKVGEQSRRGRPQTSSVIARNPP